jgi:hypothetical protein
LIRVDAEEHKIYLEKLLELYGSEELSHWKGLPGNEWRRFTKDDNGELLRDLHQVLIDRSHNG